MSEVQQKIVKIKEKITLIENELSICRKILRGEKIE